MMAMAMQSFNKRTEPLVGRLKESEFALLNNQKLRESDIVSLKKFEKAGGASQYLRKILRDVLPRALHDICQVRPADPIEYLAKWLYKAADSDLYFQDKALFEREKHKVEVRMKAEDIKRQHAIERYKKHISELKVCIKKEEHRRVSVTGSPTKHILVQKHGHAAPGRHRTSTSKPDPVARRKTLFDLYSDQSRLSTQSLQSEPLFPESPSGALRASREERTSKEIPVIRKEYSPPERDAHSVVSVRKDSSSSKTLDDGTFERSPSTRTSSSRTVSRRFSLSHEDGDSELSSHVSTSRPRDKGKVAKLAAYHGKKHHERAGTRLKDVKGELPLSEVVHHRQKKSKIDDFSIDVSAGYVALDDRDEISHDVLHVSSSTDQMHKLKGTHKTKPSEEKLDKRKSTLKDTSKRHSDRYRKGSLGEDLLPAPYEVQLDLLEEILEYHKQVDDVDNLSDTTTSLLSDQQITEFEGGSPEQLAIEEDETFTKKRSGLEIVSLKREQPIRRKEKTTTGKKAISSKVKETRSGEEGTAGEFDEVTGKIDSEADISDEELDEDGEQGEEGSPVRKMKSQRVHGKRRMSKGRRSSDTEEDEKLGDEGEDLEAQVSKRVIVKRRGSKGRKGIDTEEEQPDHEGKYLEAQFSKNVKRKRRGSKGRKSIDTEEEQPDHEGKDLEAQVSKRVIVKRRGSKGRKSIDTEEDEKPSDEGDDLDVPGKPIVVIKIKTKKKAQAKKPSVISTEDEDTEYEEEPRRSMSRRLSSGSKRPSLKQMEEEAEEDGQQVTRAGKRGTIKSITSTMDEDRKRAARKQVKKKFPSVTIDLSGDESLIGLDDESIRTQSDTPAESTVDSLDLKKRVKRRIKKQGRKSTDDEESEYPSDRLSFRFPSTDTSTEDLLTGPSVSRLGPKKGKTAISRRKSFSKKSLMDSAKRVSSKGERSPKHFGQVSIEELYQSLGSDNSETPEETLDSAIGRLGKTEETETFPFTPVECEWFLVGARTLVCHHPILGHIRSRPLIAAQNFYGWPDRINYNWRAFYDHEVYTVVEPYANENRFKQKKNL